MWQSVKVRAHITVFGRVQGIFYRANTKEIADRLGVRGWVRNLKDGRVEAMLEGEKGQVEELLSWCRQGPPGAHVERVEVQWKDFEGEFPGFSIRY